MDPVTLEPAARVRPAIVLAVFGALGVFAAAPASGATFTDLPAKETVVSAPLPAVPSQDVIGWAGGKTDGQLALLTFEDTRLKSRHSGDGGATFGAEVELDAGGPDVKIPCGAFSAEGKGYAAWSAVDPAGDLGLRFARTDDMGQTWTAPVTLVASGAASFGVGPCAIATGGPGQAAIVYRGNESLDPYVITTSNSGATWTTPVRIDGGVPAGSAPIGHERIAMDGTGRIFAVYGQDRGSGDTTYYTRSTNGGTTFAAEQALALPAHTSSEKPEVRVATDGNVLIALWDSAGTNHVYVMRSTDQGQTYLNVMDHALAGDNVVIEPQFEGDPATGVTFVHWVRSSNTLVVARSADSGATWGADQVIATTPEQSLLLAGGAAMSRSPAGTWVIGWTDGRADTYAGLFTGVYLRASTDQGVSWGTEKRADGGVAGTHSSSLTGMTPAQSDNVFVAYRDGRDDNGRSTNVYGNRVTASTLSFGPDYRVDTDDGTVTPFVMDQVTVATDGVTHVYEAFPAFTTGPQSDILVAVSSDSGRHFAIPVRVGSTAAGTRIALLPQVRAFSDGRVYLVYMSDNPGVGREIRFNRSTTFGTTWQAGDTVLATLAAHGPGYFAFYNWPGTDVAALSDGTVYVAWSDSANVFLARSIDGGQNFSTADVDQDGRAKNRYPRICAGGTFLALSFMSPNVSNGPLSVWAVTSADKGVTWATSHELRTDNSGTNTSGVDVQAIACDGAGHAVVVWPDARNGTNYRLFSSRFDGSTWSVDAAMTSPPGVNQLLPSLAYVNAGTAVVVYEDEFDGIYTSRSTDDGATFPTFQRLDSAAPVQAAGSYLGRVTTDGAGHVWASWLDTSAGLLPSLVVRHSADSGATFGSVYRLDRKTPQGGSQSGNLIFSLNIVQSTVVPPYGSVADALPGAAIFGWAAERESVTLDALSSAYDVNDFDRDGVGTASDCNDGNPDVQHAPVEIASVALAKVTGAVRLSWTSQDPTAGVATVYNIVTGLLGDLRSSHGFAAATCLQNGIADTPFDDSRSGPPAGNGFYYLVRAKNPCGTGSYGNSSLTPDPRDALDSGALCP